MVKNGQVLKWFKDFILIPDGEGDMMNFIAQNPVSVDLREHIDHDIADRGRRR